MKTSAVFLFAIFFLPLNVLAKINPSSRTIELNVSVQLNKSPIGQVSLKVDKDDVTTAGLYNLTGSFKQNLKTGVALDSTSVVAYDLKVPFSSDLEMQDTAGEDLTVIDVSSSRIDGQKSKVQKTFTAADPVSIVAAIDWVQATAGLSTLEDIDESGEKTNLISLDFGQSNKVYLEIKN